MHVGAIEFVVPVDKPYAVVELKLDDGELFSAAVACTWLEGIFMVPKSASDDTYIKMANICYYPPSDKVSSYLQMKKKPLPAWERYNDVRILALCKSMGQAKEKMEDALNKTDVSESDSAIPSKRARKAVSRYRVEMSKCASTQNFRRSYHDTADNNSSDSDAQSDSARSGPTLQLSQKLLTHNRPSSQTKILEKSKSGEGSSKSSSKPNKECSPLLSSEDRERNGANRGEKDMSLSESQKSAHPESSSKSSNTQSPKAPSIVSDSHSWENIDSGEDEEETSLLASSSSCSSNQIPKKPSSHERSRLKDFDPGEGTSRTSLDAGEGTSRTSLNRVSRELNFEELESNDIAQKETPPSVLKKTPPSFQKKTPAVVQKKTPTKGLRVKSPGRWFSPSKSNVNATYRTIQAQLSELRKKVDGLYSILNRLFRALSGNVEGPSVEVEGEKVSILPLNSFDDVNEFEKYLGANDNMLEMVAYLADYGASTGMKDSVYAMMKKLLTNKLASQFNFNGTVRKDSRIIKKKFKDSPGYTLILGALKRHCNELARRKLDGKHFYDEAVIIGFIQKWLANAPKRLRNERPKTTGDNNEDEVELPQL